MWSQLRKDLAVSPFKPVVENKQQPSSVPPSMKYEDEECSDDDNLSRVWKEACSIFEDRCKKGDAYEEHSDCKAPSSSFQEDNGHGKITDGQENYKVRRGFCNIHCSNRREKQQYKNRVHITGWRDKKHTERETRWKKSERTQENWFKITIPNGIKYHKTWLLKSLQRHCNIPFFPVDFHYVKNHARFFLQNDSAVFALREISSKILDEENKKIYIFVSKSNEPYSVQNKLKPEELEQLEVTFSRRYDGSQQALDLQKLRFDPGLVAHNVDIILNLRSCMTATLRVIEKNFPELLSLNLCNNKLYQLDGLSDIVQMVPTVKILNLSKNELKSAWELSKMKGLKLEELWLVGNPLCDTFADWSSYMSAIRAYFPTLLRLDGKELPPLVGTDVQKPCKVKKKTNIKESETMQKMILRFLQRYYSIYDSGDRQALQDIYHAQALSSMAISFNPDDPDPNSLWHYLKDSRNMLKLKDSCLRFKLLRYTNHGVVNALCLLPQTHHDINSFLVDLWVHTKTMICFSVYGLFKEVKGRFPGSVRAFTRTFIITPGSNSSPYIMNDELFVRDATAEETIKALSIPLPMPTCSSVPTLSQKQQEMVRTFSAQSGMNLKWSQKCLEDNEWNYTKAGQIFITFKNEGKIPKEAFKPNP